MGKNKDPPPFTLDKQYTQRKTEVKAWLFSAKTTDKNKAALSIALSLPKVAIASDRESSTQSSSSLKEEQKTIQ